MSVTTAVDVAPDPVRTSERRFIPWVRQAHVVLAVATFAKLIWFNLQLDVRFASPALYVVTLGTVVLLFAPTALLGEKARTRTVLVLDLAITLLVLADLVYYRYFFGVMSVATLQQSSQTGDVMASILTLLSPWDALLFVDLVWSVVVLKRRGRATFLRSAGGVRSARSKELTVFALIIGLALVTVPIEAQRRGGDAFNGWWDMATYQFTGLVGFHAYDLARYARQEFLQPAITTEERQLVDDYFDKRAPSVPDGAMPSVGEFEGSNVILLQVEALESMVLESDVDGVAVTPNLDRLASRSLRFDNFYHQASQGRTSDAELLVDCSLHPAKFGTAFFRYSEDDFACLPESLRSAGYKTSVHHAYQGSFWNRNAMYPVLGYDEFFSIKDYRLDEEVGWSLGDRSFLAQASQQLATTDEPFYAKIVTITSHHPYDLPTLEPDLDVGSLDDTQLGDYLRSIHYTDAAIGNFLDWFDTSPLAEDTILVLYGDHDSGIYDDELLDRFAPTRTTLDSEIQRRSVPLLIDLPGNDYDGARVKTPAGQIDVAPMIAHLLGVTQPGAMLGVNRLATSSTPVVFRNGSFIDAETYYSQELGCRDVETDNELPATRCQERADEATTQLRVSDVMLDHDLMTALP
jgi:lipoteichoic acid synthase